MSVLDVEPSKTHPMPYSMEDEVPSSILEELAVAGATAELQVALGAELDLSPDDVEREKRLLEVALKAKKTSITTQSTAFAAAAFLRTYASSLALDVVAARSAVTNKLLELANCGDPKFELKALELLGKHSDIGLFTERSEITINYKNPEDLENAIKERVKRLLNATIIDITPIETTLDDELGLNESTKDLADEIAEEIFGPEGLTG